MKKSIKEANKSPAHEKYPPKLEAKKSINLTAIDISENEIIHQQDTLIHDNNYLMDKSVKKVSVATLKRRQQ